MGVHHPANPCKCLIQFDMGGSIRGWIVSALYLISQKIHNDHILRVQPIIIHTAGLNGKISAFSVYLADIPPGKGNQPILWKFHIGTVNPFF